MSNYRSPIRTIQTDWRTGEIDPAFAMRVESKALSTGARRLTNMLIRNTGACERRPGMLTEQTIGAARTRLLEFEFDADEKYVVGFSAGAVRIWNAAGAAMTVTPSTGQPWSTDKITWEINVLQRADVMLIVHRTFKIRRLRRTGSTTFVMETLQFDTDEGANVLNQPYIRYATETIGVRLSSYVVGAAVATFSQGILSAAWNGERFRIWNCEVDIGPTGFLTATTANVQVRQLVRADLGIAPLRVEKNSGLVYVTHPQHGLIGNQIVVEGATDLFGIAAAEINGPQTIYGVDSDHYYFTVSPAFSTSAGDGGGSNVHIRLDGNTYTKQWAEQVWSDRRGWPGAITLHENRLWMGGSTAYPTFLAGSAVGDYYDFSVRDGLDDESVQGTISATSRIIHLVSAKQLQIFCENSESVVETQNGEPITPGSLKVVNHTAYGVDPNVRPRVFDGATLFAQRNGKNIRELIYDFNSDSHVALPVSILASHLIRKPNDVAVLLGTATRPEQYAFFVNADGTCAVLHSIRSEELAAWTLFTSGGAGFFDSVCCIGTSVFFSVKRGTTYYLDRFELDATDVWLDSAVHLTGQTSSNVILGTAYANKTVTVMSNGWSWGTFTADAAGVVTLPALAEDLFAGYDPGVVAIPMPPDKEMNDGPMTGEIRRIVATTLHFRDSVSASVNGREILGYQTGQDVSLPPILHSGKKVVRKLGYSRDPDITVSQPNPGPLVLLGLVHQVSI